MGTKAAAHPKPAPRGAPAGGRSRSTVLLGVLPVVVAVVGFAVFAATRGGDDSAQPTFVGHVHGLGHDPDSGELYAGTHFGLYRFTSDAAPARQGPVQDLMGFTVVGPDHFLASGHPGEGQPGPTSVGVIESTDGGRTWSTLALEGEVDFHTLEASGDTVYGVDLDVLMTSADGGRTWGRAASLVATDLAISPGDPATLVAATSGGVQRSTDGGRTFASVASGAPVALLAWPSEDELIAVSEGGNVFTSADGGTSWKRVGELGVAPEALAATDDRIVVATSRGIEVSTDGGRTFDVRHPTT